MFRIVAEKRGDAVTGFRVQKMGRTRRGCDMGEMREAWVNKGRRVFTVKDAEALRAYFESEQIATMPEVTYEEIGRPEAEFARPAPEFFGQYGRK